MKYKGQELGAGMLKRAIEIQKDAATSVGTDGMATESARSFAKPMAKIEPLTGRELVNASQVHAGVTHEILVRYIPGVTEQMWCLYDGRRLNFTSILNLHEANRWLVITATEFKAIA